MEVLTAGLRAAVMHQVRLEVPRLGLVPRDAADGHALACHRRVGAALEARLVLAQPSEVATHGGDADALQIGT